MSERALSSRAMPSDSARWRRAPSKSPAELHQALVHQRPQQPRTSPADTCGPAATAAVGQEQPAVVEQDDAAAQQAPALFGVAGNDAGCPARDIARGRASRFMGA